jgi:ATP-dependent Clp protease protease subunit
MSRRKSEVDVQQGGQQVITIDQISLGSLGAHLIFDEINHITSRFACEFIIKANMMFESCAPLVFLINSEGGSVSDGWAIVDTMYTSALPINTVILGEACSMATIIATAGTAGYRYMTQNSYVMTHQFWTIMGGKSHELMAVRKLHDTMDAQFVEHFKRHTKMSEKQIKDVLLRQSDTWLTPKECLKYGLVDKIVSEPWTQIRKDREKFGVTE